MEDVLALLRAAENHLSEAEEALSKIDLGAAGETLVSCQKVIERHQVAQKNLLNRKVELLCLLKNAMVVVKGDDADRYRVTHQGGYVEYVAWCRMFDASFGSGHLHADKVAESELYWPVVENYIGLVQTAIRAAADTTVPQEATKTEKVLQEVSSLADGLKG